MILVASAVNFKNKIKSLEISLDVYVKEADNLYIECNNAQDILRRNNMAVHSYLRISTLDKGQTVENQRKAIRDAGFATDHWYAEEGVSGSVPAKQRPEFALMMAKVATNDLIVVTALDRLGRDAEDILNTVNNFEKMGVKVCILALGNTDITSVMGKAFVVMLSALAEMERNTIKIRTRQGLARAKEQGVILGPKLKLPPATLRKMCEEKEAGCTLSQLSEKYGENVMTIQRNLAKYSTKLDEYEANWNKREAQYALKDAA